MQAQAAAFMYHAVMQLEHVAACTAPRRSCESRHWERQAILCFEIACALYAANVSHAQHLLNLVDPDIIEYVTVVPQHICAGVNLDLISQPS